MDRKGLLFMYLGSYISKWFSCVLWRFFHAWRWPFNYYLFKL